MCELFEKLNAPFRYEEYEYNKDDERVYVNGQAVAERLNQVLGVGYWSYKPVPGSIELIDTGRKNRNNEPIRTIKLLVQFSIYNKELNQWITFEDAGSQDLNARMGQGDATKSAITDGMKKCASRIGVASDLYKGLIRSRKDTYHPDGGYALLPDSYKEYYEKQGWVGRFIGDKPGDNNGSGGNSGQSSQGGNNNHGGGQVTEKPASDAQIRKIKGTIVSLKLEDKVHGILMNRYKVDVTSKLTMTQASDFITYLTSLQQKAN
jgi:hypothetical protein